MAMLVITRGWSWGTPPPQNAATAPALDSNRHPPRGHWNWPPGRHMSLSSWRNGAFIWYFPWISLGSPWIFSPGWWLTYPSETWWSSSVGVMTFRIYGKIKHVPNHQPVTNKYKDKWSFFFKYFNHEESDIIGIYNGYFIGFKRIFLWELTMD